MKESNKKESKLHQGTGNQLLQDDDARFFLASVIDSLYDSVVTINLDGTITSWNRSAERIYGYPAAEAIGKSLSMLTISGDFRELLAKVDVIRNGHDVPIYDTLRLHKGGHLLQLEITLSPVKNHEGQVIGVSTVARDVTELRKAHEGLARSESRLRAIIEAAIDFGIITIDDHGVIRDWNSGAENIFGYTREEIIGKHTEILFTPEDRHAGVPIVEIKTAQSTGRSIDERWHLHKDGSRFFMSGVMTPTRDSFEPCYVKIARNITERKLTEESLLLSEQRKTLAVQSAEMGEWEWELNNNTIRISEQVCVLLGLPVEQRQVTPESLLQRLYPGDLEPFQEELNKAVSGLNIFKTECRILRADNKQVRWVNVYGRIVAHAGEQPSKLIGVFYDITPRKLLEKQKEDFISMASHELKTPVTAIKAYTELLEESFAETDQNDNLLLLRKLNRQVDRLINLMQHMLDASSLSEGRIKLYPETFDLADAIDHHMDTLEAISSSHTLVWDKRAIPLIHADKDRILQVVDNFVTNAVKYSPPGTHIILSVQDETHQVHVSVKDKGMGIPQEVQQLVFERYFRGDHDKGDKGFGLGLFVCSQIIKEHHGTIGLTSTPGDGSTFYFTLPYS